MSVQLGEWKDGKLYIEGLEYTFPKKPASKLMKNFGLPKNRQLWTRYDDYLNFDWGKGWEDRLDDNPKQLQYLIDEVERLHKGVWIIIDGEEVYVNKYQYFFCNWYKLENNKYPDFRDASLYYYRFLEICEKKQLCTGHTLLKGRRFGATSMALATLQLLLITTTDVNYGIVSNKGDNAKKAFSRVVKSMGNLPVFLKPIQEGNTAPKKVLSLREQSKRITKDNRQSDAQEGLNNELSWENTDLNSYDSYALAGLLLDEGSKYPKDCPINEYLPVVTQCLKEGALVKGKIIMPTTCNPPQSGGKEYRIVYNNSNQAEANELGETKTGLYRIMVPSYYGYRGYVLPTGRSIWQTPTKEETEQLKKVDGCPDPNIGAKEYLENKRKELENDVEALQDLIRHYPFNAEEVFESANERCLFNLKNLNQRENELVEKAQEQGINPNTDELGRRGWFHKHPNNTVMWVDDPKGLWYIHQFPKPEDCNKFRVLNNGLEPLNQSYGAAGLDPIQSGQATVDLGSDCSCIIHRRYSIADEENSDLPVALFLGRMEDIDKLYEQIYNGLIYYGVKMLAERAPDYFAKYAKDKGLENYLYGTKRADGSEVKGIVAQQTANVKEEHARVQVMKALDCWHKIPYLRLIRDMKEFNINKRTLYDACMSWGYSLIALDFPYEQIKKQNTPIKLLSYGKITTY